MTVSTNTSVTTYDCNGVTSDFATGFKFVSRNSLTVTRITVATGDRVTMVDATEDPLAGYPLSYFVAGVGDEAGGTITLGNIWSADYQIEIARTTPVVQELNLVDNDGADAESMESALDRLTMICQELNQTIQGVVSAPLGATAVDNASPESLGLFPDTMEIPLFGYQLGTTYYIRRLVLQGYHLWNLTQNYAFLIPTGLIRNANNFQSDPATDCYNAALQLANNCSAGEPIEVWWDESQAADVGKWSFRNVSAGVAAIAAIKDDMSAQSDFLQFTRSGATAVSNKLAVMLDANAKRIGNVAAFDFDEQDKGDVTGNVTFDFSAYNTIKCRFTGNVTATFTAPNGPTTTYIEVTQDGTGSRTITFPAAVKWTAATAAGDKLLSTGASKRDLIVLKWNGAGTAALAQIFKDW